MTNAQNLKREQLEGRSPPLLCNAVLPTHLNLDPNRDWDRLAEVLHECYPESFPTLEEVTKWVEERRPRLD